MDSSDSLSPTDEIGGASSQSPECGADAAKSLALSISDDALSGKDFGDQVAHNTPRLRFVLLTD